MNDFQGEIAAMLAAGLWAIASTIYGRLGRSIPPLQLNLIKGVVAIALLLLTILIRGEFFNISPLPTCLLLLSGVVGIGLGDTAFLAAINNLGARRVLLIQTLAPPMTAILAQIFLQERLNLVAWCGIALTILGVAWVVTERVPNTSESTTDLWRGIGFALLSTICLAIGAILSRAALANTNISPLWAGLLRLIAAVLILLIWIPFKGQLRIQTPSTRVILSAVFASFCGTFLGIWLQQVAIKFTAVGIATTLLQTSPLFVIPISLAIGEKVSLRGIIGVVIAIAGIALLFYLK
ncbi:DMT family transporter [Iningainema tapete]|uniref:DMT family transporter n=1 Tax=Iningainema tapete BLCC-T55 TaxID=2748662 RepID=A0A8J6XUR5_9CYAN|nr:DMT family transporter [Iningainema tapete]MBD2774133.1 DMT family transporter [Iningainema tapete BLCC-T55]